MKRIIYFIFATVIVFLTGCSTSCQPLDGEGMERSYTQISQEEAREMMKKDNGASLKTPVQTEKSMVK